MSALDQWDLASFLRDFTVAFGANLCAGTLLALLAALLTWWVGAKLNIFQQAEERRARRLGETRGAIEWLRLLREEAQAEEAANKLEQMLESDVARLTVRLKRLGATCRRMLTVRRVKEMRCS